MTEREWSEAEVRSWLRDEPLAPLPEHVAEAVMLAVGSTRQRRRRWSAVSTALGPRFGWLPVGAALVLAVVGLAVLRPPVVGPEPTLPGAVATPTPAASGSQEAPALTGEPSTSPEEIRGLSWSAIGTVESKRMANGGGSVLAAGLPDGYIYSDGSSTISHSTDGIRWAADELTFDGGIVVGVTSIASDGGSVVIGGEYTSCSRSAWERNPFADCATRPATWVTTDGQTWRSSAPWTGLIAEPGKSGSWFSEIWAVPGVGWEAAQIFSGFDESDDLDPTGPAIWRSTDGLLWSLLADRVATLDEGCSFWTADQFRALADDTGDRVATLPCDEGLRLWRSIDGVSYTPVEGFAPGQGSGMLAGLAARAGSPWILGGIDSVGGEALWSSGDLQAWTETPMVVAGEAQVGRITAMATHESSYVAIGQAAGGRIDTWISLDAASWDLADAKPPAELSIAQIVNGPAGTLGFGPVQISENAYELTVWRLQAQP